MSTLCYLTWILFVKTSMLTVSLYSDTLILDMAIQNDEWTQNTLNNRHLSQQILYHCLKVFTFWLLKIVLFEFLLLKVRISTFPWCPLTSYLFNIAYPSLSSSNRGNKQRAFLFSGKCTIYTFSWPLTFLAHIKITLRFFCRSTVPWTLCWVPQRSRRPLKLGWVALARLTTTKNHRVAAFRDRFTSTFLSVYRKNNHILRCRWPD